MKALQLLLNEQLPEDLRDYNRKYDAKDFNNILLGVAQRYPHKYEEITKNLADIGRHAAYNQGETLTLDDMRPVLDRDGILQMMDKEIEQAKRNATSKKDFQDNRNKIWTNYSSMLEKQTMGQSLKHGTNLAFSIASGARGKPGQLKAMITTPGTFSDSNENIIPLFVRHSVSEGLSPAEFLASTYGARSSVISTKVSTAKGGDLCLAESTKVRMSDMSVKAIRDINVGDLVLGSNKDGHIRPVRVLHKFDQGIKDVSRLAFYPGGRASKGSTEIEELVTTEHKFLTEHRDRDGSRSKVIKTLGDMDKGDSFCTPSYFDDSECTYAEPFALMCGLMLGDGCIANASVPSKISKYRVEYAGQHQCYDIEVDHPDHLFVLASGIICSNSKQLFQNTANLVISTKDCGATNGVDYPVDDKSLKGRLLARAVEGYPAGTVIDRVVINHLNKKGVKDVIARSALTCEAKDGLCAKCMGMQANGKLPRIGEMVGATASQAVGEPVTQAALNQKHVAGQTAGKKSFSGFGYINQFVQSPEDYKDRAALSKHDGLIETIREAPQGGKLITINGEDHYVHKGFNLMKDVGDKVSKGDQLSEGLVDAAEVVDTQGLGEGRRYYATRLKQLLDDSGMEADLRNTEVIARGAVNHVELNDIDENHAEHLPGDMLYYNQFMRNYTPPTDTKTGKPSALLNHYLQNNALHYTVGTRITPKVAKKLESTGFDNVSASKEEPSFTPTMIRLRTATQASDDWLQNLSTSYLKKQIHDGAVKGQDTNVKENTNWAPRLAYGTGFGDNIETTGKF